MIERYNHDGPVASGSAAMLNPGGDTAQLQELRRYGGRTLVFRCGSCGYPCRAFAPETSPVVAKFKCRRCDYVMEVKTRDEAMDAIEDHIEEGAFEQRILARTDGSRGSRRPSVYTSHADRVKILDDIGALTKIQTPWGNGTLIKGG